MSSGQLSGPVVGHRGQRVPVVGVGAAAPRRRPAGPAARPRPARSAAGPGRVGDGRGAGRRPARTCYSQPGPARRRAPSRSSPRQQLGQEPGRPLVGVLAAHGGDHQPAPGPGRGHVEQPALLGQQLGGQRGGAASRGVRARSRSGHLGDQLVDAQQRAAQPQVGPDALLDAGHDHHVPLQALGRGARSGCGPRRPSGARSASVSPAISWRGQVVQEHLGARRAAAGRRTGPPCRTAPPPRRGPGRPARPGAARRRSARVHRSARPLACQTAHSTSSALPPLAYGLAGGGDAACASRSAGSATWGSTRTSSRASCSAATEQLARRARCVGGRTRVGRPVSLLAAVGGLLGGRAPRARRSAGRGAGGARRACRCRRAGRSAAPRRRPRRARPASQRARGAA